jgi:hypothetical protein
MRSKASRTPVSKGICHKAILAGADTTPTMYIPIYKEDESQSNGLGMNHQKR